MRWIPVAAALGLLHVAAARAESIVLGAILPLTGPVAAAGERQARGLRFAVEQVNADGGLRGHRLELAMGDSQGRPDVAIAALDALRARHRMPIVLSAWSGPVLAMAPLATKYNILLLNAGARAGQLDVASPYLFNLLPPVRADIAVLTRHLARNGVRRVADLFENTAAGISGRDDFDDAFDGMTIARETVFFGDTAFRAALTRLAAAKPQAIVVSATSGLVELARAYRSLGLDIPVVGTGFFQAQELVSSPDAEGFAHTRLRVEVPPEIAAAFETHFGAEMDTGARLAWLAVRVAAIALDRVLAAQGPPTGETLRAAILQIRLFPGPIVFETQTADIPIDMAVIRGGRDVPLPGPVSDRPPPGSPAPKGAR